MENCIRLVWRCYIILQLFFFFLENSFRSNKKNTIYSVLTTSSWTHMAFRRNYHYFSWRIVWESRENFKRYLFAFRNLAHEIVCNFSAIRFQLETPFTIHASGMCWILGRSTNDAMGCKKLRFLHFSTSADFSSKQKRLFCTQRYKPLISVADFSYFKIIQ